MMPIDEIKEYRNLNIGDLVRIKDRFIPPVLEGLKPVSMEIVKYIRDNGNIFTICRILPYKSPIFKLYEVMSVVDYRHLSPFRQNGSIRIFNWKRIT